MRAKKSILIDLALIPMLIGVGTRIDAQTSEAARAGTFEFVHADSAPCGTDKVVKSAPYSAESVTEVTRVLGDGNRIVRKSTTLVYRDSEGRKRLDHTVSNIGPLESSGCQCQTVSITDPVAGVRYIMDSETKTVRKHRLPTSLNAVPCNRMGEAARGDETVESLGTQMIEGVRAEGVRATVNIAADKIGNEKPIRIVSERWFSPELQVYLLTKRSDPRFGETVHRLVNLKRREPSAELFQVPAGYALSQSRFSKHHSEAHE